MNNEIHLPEEDPPMTLEARLRGAIYAASMYHTVTPIVQGHRRVYIVPEWMYDKFVADERSDRSC